jgi:hypothetical protein
MTLSRAQAADAVAGAAAERDTMQSNILELDNSLGVRLLKDVPLTGESKSAWESGGAALAALWELFDAYSQVIEDAAALMTGRPGERALERVDDLLNGPSVSFSPGPVPLAQRDLADTGTRELSVAAARATMRGQFAEVAKLAEQAERRWNEMAAQLEMVAADLARAGAPGEQSLDTEAAAIRTELARLRDELNSDPLAARADRAAPLRDRAAAYATRARESVRLRDTADARIAALAAAADAARAARDEALAARDRAAAKVVVRAQIPALPDPAPRLAAVASLRAAGRWNRLAAELDQLETDLAAATTRFEQTSRELAALLATRDELRGLLDAYKAKAARLGAVEDVAALHDAARELLWTAPCDLDRARVAVLAYQRAVLTRGTSR